MCIYLHDWQDTGPGEDWRSAPVEDKYPWLEGVRAFEFWTFNVSLEFLCLFVYGFKTGESRNDLGVRNLTLRNGPWVAIYCKAGCVKTTDKNEHAREMQRVIECLQGKHGFANAKACEWALTPPKGFGEGKIWAIARLGLTSPVMEVSRQVLESLTAKEAREKYSELAGTRAAATLAVKHIAHNRGQGATKNHYTEASMEFLMTQGVLTRDEEAWLHAAANTTTHDGNPAVCPEKQTCTPTGAKRKYITTISDVILLNYAVGLETHSGNTQGVWLCRLPRDSVPLHKLVLSRDYMSDLKKIPRHRGG